MYYVFRCKSCGVWRVREIKNSFSVMFKCFHCNKSFKIKKKGYGLALMNKGPYDARKAGDVCRMLNEKKKI